MLGTSLALAGLSVGVGAAVVEAAVARGGAPSWLAAVTGAEEAVTEAPPRVAARPAHFAATRAPEPLARRAPPEASEPKATPAKPAEGPAAKTQSPEDSDEPVHRDKLAGRAGEGAPPDVSSASPQPAEPATQRADRTEHEPRTLDALMEGALPEEPTEAEPEPAPTERRIAPTRREVVGALEDIRPRIRECAAGEHGLAKLEITFGSSGRVRAALVDGPFAGSPAGSCMAKAARGIELEAFDEKRFQIRHSFRL